jgi:enamine deaminase RidA (YjgF/YER057c/UK114 family)
LAVLSEGGGRVPRRLVSSGGPWEARYGYSRAVVAGDACHVAGTTDAGEDGRSRHPGDAAAQARAALEIIDCALADGGFSRADVVRTRMYLTDRADAAAVGEVHGEWFRDVRPASTLVIVPRSSTRPSSSRSRLTRLAADRPRAPNRAGIEKRRSGGGP